MGDSIDQLIATDPHAGATAPPPASSGDSIDRLIASGGPNTSAPKGILDKTIALDSPADATWSGVQSVVRGVRDAATGAVNAVRHPIDTAKSIADLPSQVAQVPGAIRDINKSADSTGTYLHVGQETAGQAAGQALLAIGTEGLGKAAPTVAKGAKAVGKELVNRAPAVGTTAGAAIGAKVAGTPGAIVGGAAGKLLGDVVKSKLSPSFPSYDGTTATEYAGEGARGRAIPTDSPAPKGGGPAEGPGYRPPTGTVDNPSVTPEGATPKSAHPDAAEFEKTFGAPIDNYVDQAGKLNTPDFLNDIVKPKTQSPNDVINRTFGNEGVELTKKLNGGKYLDKWESNDPARANPAVSGGSGAATVEKTAEVPARGYLKKVGADEGSILNGVGRTPGEHADSVNYHREQIRAGTSTPSELHVDQDGNVIGADGRHRALAAIQEHGPDAKIKVRVVQHRFQGVE